MITLQGENGNNIDARGLGRSPIDPGANQGGQKGPRLLPGLPGQSGIGGHRQGDGGIPPRGGPGKEEKGAVRHRTAQQQGRPKGHEGPGSLNPRAGSEEVEDILHNTRAAVAMGRGDEAKAMAAILHQQNVVEQGEHVVEE